MKTVVKDHMSKFLKYACTFVVASEVALRSVTPIQLCKQLHDHETQYMQYLRKSQIISPQTR